MEILEQDDIEITDEMILNMARNPVFNKSYLARLFHEIPEDQKVPPRISTGFREKLYERNGRHFSGPEIKRLKVVLLKIAYSEI